ncbi:hypothetical protein EIP91_010590 [Steccherinum ochraceum]|uniref:Protein kinase domain-containing protein n=1 Tax=Steccherinum ochraceum TaxID=92696 RepID=A0A4R0RCJ9_9APHY|nr:hypothetical protein EIP91_010590 [Steccherinum ochraceum]
MAKYGWHLSDSASQPWPDAVVWDQYWKDHYDFILARGFALRDHWRPGSSMLPSTGYDASLRRPAILPDGMDARDTRNGRVVMIRKLQTSSFELQLLTALSTRELREYPDNPCCKLLSRFCDRGDPATTFIVVPCPHDPFRPFFYNVDEIMQYGKQVLQGIAFLHTRNVANVFPLPEGMDIAIPFQYDHQSILNQPFNTQAYKRPQNILYYLTHLRYAVLQNQREGDSAGSGSDLRLMRTPDTSTEDQTVAEPRDYLLPDDLGKLSMTSESRTSESNCNLLSLNLHGNDDPPTREMTHDLRRFVFAFVRYLRIISSGTTLSFLAEFEELVLGAAADGDPPNARRALNAWCSLDKRLSFFERYLWNL